MLLANLQQQHMGLGTFDPIWQPGLGDPAVSCQGAALCLPAMTLGRLTAPTPLRTRMSECACH